MSDSHNGFSQQNILFTSNNTLVTRAVRESDNQTVITRTLNSEYPSQLDIARLSWSYQLLEQFNHPNIVSAIDFIESERHPILVMEDIDGIDLSQYLAKRPPSNQHLTIAEFFEIALQLANAISAMHNANVIHKDLHPGNIIINPTSGLVQIIDFSLSTSLSREQPSFQPTNQIEGVLSYLSPELTGRMNRAVDYRSDFYSLGVVFYQLLTGQLPFTGKDALEIIHGHIAKQPIPVSYLQSDVPTMLCNITTKLLSKNAEDRYQSAEGLIHDLSKCKQNTERIFKLGEQDIPNRFQVPQKLYGRDTEIAQLNHWFQEAAIDHASVVSVSGYSGIGKSSLIHEVYKPIAETKGHFTYGKFDQLDRNKPYSALQQALQGWIQHALTHSDSKLTNIKQELLNRVGENLHLIVDFLPELKLIVGNTAKTTKLDAAESKRRFYDAFRHFIDTLCRHEPLVIFVDDIQWADIGSLDLLIYLSNHLSNQMLLIIVAYRDNEVSPGHPAMMALDKIQRQGIPVHTLTLKPLDESAINQLLSESLHASHHDVETLAKLVSNKTAGNPFFINEFLKTLYYDGLLDFDQDTRRWNWSVKAIVQQDITDNVVDLMLTKMSKLDDKTQHLMQLAACIGGQFDLNTLSIISEFSLSKTVHTLWPALTQGLLLQDGGDWLPGLVDKRISTNEKNPNIAISPRCKFLHDRMLQAAYESMEEKQRQLKHLEIGRLLKTSTQNQEIRFNLFTITEQMNRGRIFVLDEAEKLELTHMNLQASEDALSASVWHTAASHADIGIELLPEDSWERHYRLTAKLYNLGVQTNFLIQKNELAQGYFDEAFNHLRTDEEKAVLCIHKARYLITHGLSQECYDLWQQALGFCGVHLDYNQDTLDQRIVEKTEKINNIISREGFDFNNLKRVSDERSNHIAFLMSNIAQASAIFDLPKHQLLETLTGIEFTLQNGVTNYTGSTLSGFCHILTRERKYAKANKFALQTLRLVESMPEHKDCGNVYLSLGVTSLTFSCSLDFAKETLLKGYSKGLSQGDIARGLMCYLHHAFYSIYDGTPLNQAKDQLLTMFDTYQTLAVSLPVFSAWKKLIHRLTDHEDFSDAEYESFDNILIQYRQVAIAAQLLQAFWTSDYQKTEELGEIFQSKLDSLTRMYFNAEHFTISGVTLCLTSINNHEKTLNKDRINRYLNELELLSKSYAPSFEHKYWLLKAVYQWATSSNMEHTTKNFKQAIALAKQHGFIQFQALGNELYARFWQQLGFEEYTHLHIKEAHYLYMRWECQPKLSMLEAEYPFLLTQEAIAEDLISRHDSITNPLSTQIDAASIIKSSQAISKELKQQDLLISIMKIILENAGAQSGAFILKDFQSADPDRFLIKLLVSGKDQNQKIDLLSCELEGCKEIPVHLIKYVLRTKKPLVIQNMQLEPRWLQDQYFQSNSLQSVLCTPIEYKEQTIGSLYLENSITANAFTEDRLQILDMLLSQASISLENAQLFDEIQQLNITLEEKVAQRTKDLEASNEELESFSYTVSHDLRAPLRSIRGFTAALQEECGNTIGEDGQSLLDRIISNSNKMGELIEGLLELSRTSRAEFNSEMVDLAALVNEIANNLQAQQSKTIDFHLIERATVYGDRRLLRSLIQNLLGNAVKYTSRTSTPAIQFGILENHQSDRSFMTFYIKDNGAGFDMAEYDRLFQTFSRLHSSKDFDGTGVGLSTVKRIVTRHGGKVWAEATPGKGATFYFTLPIDK